MGGEGYECTNAVTARGPATARTLWTCASPLINIAWRVGRVRGRRRRGEWGLAQACELHVRLLANLGHGGTFVGRDGGKMVTWMESVSWTPDS